MSGGLLGLGFLAPWVLLGLLSIPLLWIILRTLPPVPKRVQFPAVRLLIGLRDDTQTSAHTPWWLLVLRSLLVASVILGLAGPLLNDRRGTVGADRLVIIVDNSWGSGQDWAAMQVQLDSAVSQAAIAGQDVAIVDVAQFEGPLVFRPATLLERERAVYEPQAVDGAWPVISAELVKEGIKDHDTFWISTGLDHGAVSETLLTHLSTKGEVTVWQSDTVHVSSSEVSVKDDVILVTLQRSKPKMAYSSSLLVHGTDPSGVPVILQRFPVAFEGGETLKDIEVSLPLELRNRVTHFAVEGQTHAAARFLLADQLRRSEVAIYSATDNSELMELLQATHYAKRALDGAAKILEGPIKDILLANPAMVLMSDITSLDASDDVADWVRKGGTLVRFAGPKLAAVDRQILADDPLLPVMLRQGGRRLDGAMTWGEPKKMASFDDDGPFAGLSVPQDILISQQVLAEPSPNLAQQTIARLEDGTPLVTRNTLGLGQVVFFHVTANASWSNLPLSGLFPQMLERLTKRGSFGVETVLDPDLLWVPEWIVDGYGRISRTSKLAGVQGELLNSEGFTAVTPPGLYASGELLLSRNLSKTQDHLKPADWPRSVVIRDSEALSQNYSGFFLVSAAVLLLMDVFASLFLSGRLGRSLKTALTAFIALIGVNVAEPTWAEADIDKALLDDVVFAHILTGDAVIDRRAKEGLAGLSRILTARTSVEPGEPQSVNPEVDDLALYPFLYWPIHSGQERLDAKAYAALNTYMRGGGVLLFDTLSGDTGATRSGQTANKTLIRLTQGLDIPPLERVPSDHVLTRTFYLLQSFPGRYKEADLWIQASGDQSAEQEEGAPFRRLNDGVSPVLIGGNDWAAAWAVSASGRPLYPVGRGYAGERQRELAFRFGVNLVMYVLTGNYKSDQVHVPALLERLGQ